MNVEASSFVAHWPWEPQHPYFQDPCYRVLAVRGACSGPAGRAADAPSPTVAPSRPPSLHRPMAQLVMGVNAPDGRGITSHSSL
ncbi:hypothetical protein NDU88_000543 [Pleurodeles waltl]|uniref:Uncharacterized protein n=1 Tax=Pleurodeles waltl TaxID=8319 RepID=A0AAV7U6M3_PLEWA|nr:hypothetical protein NDU88_000543 [Pleurodeles waltl]